jgi:hypothetical protein
LTKESNKARRVPQANSTTITRNAIDALVMTNPDGSSPRNRGFGFGEVIKVGEDGRDEDDDRRGEAMGDEGLEGDIAVE